MLAGAWGVRAGEMLERAAGRSGAAVHRAGALTMLDRPQLVVQEWCCWLYGDPSYRDGAGLERDRPGGELENDLPGAELERDLPRAFGRALVAEGEQACELLGGRFVAVLYDRERDRCVISRDQLGAQPLVYARAANGVLFAAHERDLLDRLGQTPSPDRLALLQWIENGITPLGRTLYDGVHRLPAGHRLNLRGSDAHVERWWDVRYEPCDRGSAATLAGGLRETAFAAIARAAAGSERPAVKLSGGLDSACVAAGLAASGFGDGDRSGGGSARALAIGGTFSEHPLTDERELIEQTARHARLPLELIAFDRTRSMLAPALAHIASWRLPPATPNLFLWQPMMARARELGVDLLLDGEGGDELFGLAPYLIADRLRAGRLRAAWLLSGRLPGLGLDPGRDIRLRVLRHYGLKPLVPIAVRRHREKRAVRSNSLVPWADARALIDLRTANEAENRRRGPSWWRFQAEALIDTREQMDVGAHFRREAADEQIRRRHPFLYDLQLIEAVLRLPPEAQFDPLRDRPLLRDALTGRIPEAVRTRYVKSHFSPLVLAGMRADEAGLIEPLLRADAPVREYVAAEPLERKIRIAADERSLLGAGSLWRVSIANRWLACEAGQSA